MHRTNHGDGADNGRNARHGASDGASYSACEERYTEAFTFGKHCILTLVKTLNADALKRCPIFKAFRASMQDHYDEADIAAAQAFGKTYLESDLRHVFAPKPVAMPESFDLEKTPGTKMPLYGSLTVGKDNVQTGPIVQQVQLLETEYQTICAGFWHSNRVFSNHTKTLQDLQKDFNHTMKKEVLNHGMWKQPEILCGLHVLPAMEFIDFQEHGDAANRLLPNTSAFHKAYEHNSIDATNYLHRGLTGAELEKVETSLLSIFESHFQDMQTSILKAYSTPLHQLFDAPSDVDPDDADDARLNYNQKKQLFEHRQQSELKAKHDMRANVATLLKLRASKYNENLVALEVAIFLIYAFVKNLFLAHHELNHAGRNHPFHPIGLPWAMQCAISELRSQAELSYKDRVRSIMAQNFNTQQKAGSTEALPMLKHAVVMRCHCESNEILKQQYACSCCVLAKNSYGQPARQWIMQHMHEIVTLDVAISVDSDHDKEAVDCGNIIPFCHCDMCWVNAVMKSFRAHMCTHHFDVVLQLETAVSGLADVNTVNAAAAQTMANSVPEAAGGTNAQRNSVSATMTTTSAPDSSLTMLSDFIFRETHAGSFGIFLRKCIDDCSSEHCWNTRPDEISHEDHTALKAMYVAFQVLACATVKVAISYEKETEEAWFKMIDLLNKSITEHADVRESIQKIAEGVNDMYDSSLFEQVILNSALCQQSARAIASQICCSKRAKI